MDIHDSQRIKEIRDNTAKMADAFTRIADALERLTDRKDENCSEKPNNCEDFFREPTSEERKAVADYIDSISVPTGVNVFDLMDEPKTCDNCKLKGSTKWCDNQVVCRAYQPKDEPTISKMEQVDKDINVRGKWETPPKFEHKGFTTTCVSVPACLLEIEDEPQTDDKHAVCTGCDYYDLPNTFHPCASCVDFSKYKPKIEDEPPTERSE